MARILHKAVGTIAAVWLATALLMAAAVEARSDGWEGHYPLRPAVVDESKVWPAAACANVERFTEQARVTVPEAEVLPVNAADTRRIIDGYNAIPGTKAFDVPAGSTAAVAVARRLPNVVIDLYGPDGCRLGGGLFDKSMVDGFVPGIFDGVNL